MPCWLSNCSVKCPLGGIIVASLALLAACAPARPVYIPREWQTPPPAPRQPERTAVHAPPPPPPHAPEHRILKPPVAIKEKDITEGTEAVPPPPPGKKHAPPSPQHHASMHFVDQAKAALAQGKPDAAIPLLEQAIQVDVYNGEAFYSLARAWRMKGARKKALEFAKKAELLFQEEGKKLKEVCLFQAEIYKELGDPKKMELYRQKASRL